MSDQDPEDSDHRTVRMVVCVRKHEGDALKALARKRGVPPATAAWELIRDGLIHEITDRVEV